jgi:excisionase family DNA binding protein
MADSDSIIGFVYFIDTADGRYVKIGFSGNVKRRLSEIQASYPSALSLRGAISRTQQTEHQIQNLFAEERQVGEWFARSERLDYFINAELNQGHISEGKEYSHMYLTARQTAAILRVDRRTLYYWLKSGEIKAERLGRSWRIPRSSVLSS